MTWPSVKVMPSTTMGFLPWNLSWNCVPSMDAPPSGVLSTLSMSRFDTLTPPRTTSSFAVKA